MRRAVVLAVVSIGFVLAAALCSRRGVDTPQPAALVTKPARPTDRSWREWLASSDARALKPSFKAVLSEAIQRCEHQGVAAGSFNVRRAHTTAQPHHGCYPFEKQHA